MCAGFRGPTQLTSWAGLTPRHRESATAVHGGRITKPGSRAAPPRSRPIRVPVPPRERVAERRGRNVQCSTSSSRSIGRAGPRPVILPQPGPAAAHLYLCRPRPTFEIDASWVWRTFLTGTPLHGVPRPRGLSVLVVASRGPSGLTASPFTGATAAPLAVATTPTSIAAIRGCLLYTSPSPRDGLLSR